MGHCHDEAGEHDHEHGLNGSDDPERGLEFSLYRHVDTTRLRCLNECHDHPASKVFKPWEQRLDTSEYLESDCDEQLILFIPFTGDVKLKSIVVIGPPGGAHPRRLKLFKNRDDVDFDNCERETPVQEWELLEDRLGAVEYPTQVHKTSGVTSLTMYFSANYGAEVTRIYYIGLRGEVREHRRDNLVGTLVYEAAPNPADHKVAEDFANHSFVQ